MQAEKIFMKPSGPYWDNTSASAKVLKHKIHKINYDFNVHTNSYLMSMKNAS